MNNRLFGLLLITFLNLLLSPGLYASKPDSLLVLLSSAEKKNNTERIINLSQELADYYFTISNLDSAEMFYEKALDLATKNGLYKYKVISLNGLGALNYRRGDYPVALEKYFEALKTYKNYENDTLKAATLNKLAGVFYKLRELDKTLDYLEQSLELKLKIGDSVAISQTYNNLGNIYAEMGMLDKALEYYYKDLEISEKRQNLYNLPISYTNISSIYREKKEFAKALEYARKALAIDTTLGDLYGIAADYNEMALSYQGLKQYDKADLYFKKSLEIARRINASELVVAFLKDYSDFYAAKGDYKKSLEFFKQYSAYKDSLLNESKNRQIVEAEKKYETEKKNSEIQRLKFKQAKAKSVQKIFMVIIGFLFVIAGLLVIMFRYKVKANKALNEKNIQLKQLNDTQNRLMSIISHDLKAPLSAFFSITTSLKAKYTKLSNEEVEKYFDRMLNSALALKFLLENLLNWAITQQREIKVNKSSFNAGVLIYKVVMILQEFAHEKGVEIVYEVDEELEIKTDGRLLSIVLNNILSNAIKYSHPNSKVFLNAEKKNGKFVISVRDTGIGMTKDEVDKLFTGKSIAHTENSGTGLGLIVSKDIVDKLGGRIYAISEQGKGTEIIVELPG